MINRFSCVVDSVDIKVKYLSLILVLGVIFVTPFAGAVFRTITVDGQTGDWSGIQPLVTDPDDSPYGGEVTSSSEDILAVYTANDNDNLYFWMKLAGPVPESGGMTSQNLIDGAIAVYAFFLDVDPGAGDTAFGGADYVIEYAVYGVFNVVFGEVIFQPFGPYVNTILGWYNGNHWVLVDCEDVQGNAIGTNVEVSVPWDCIGGKNCVNCFFVAEYYLGEPATDWAPDRDGEEPVIVRYCPCEEAVGGELLPFDMAKTIVPYVVFGVTIVALLASLNNRKPRKIYPS